jgi:hypothetical protein
VRVAFASEAGYPNKSCGNKSKQSAQSYYSDGQGRQPCLWAISHGFYDTASAQEGGKSK